MGCLFLFMKKKPDIPYDNLLEFDPVKHETAFMAVDHCLNGNLSATEISPGTVSRK